MTEDTPDLFAQLEALVLSDEDSELLLAILKVAGDITEGAGRQDTPAFHGEFAGAFTPLPPEKVALLLAYASATPSPAPPPAPGMIVRGTLPAMIVRTSPAGHADDDDDDND